VPPDSDDENSLAPAIKRGAAAVKRAGVAKVAKKVNESKAKPVAAKRASQMKAATQAKREGKGMQLDSGSSAGDDDAPGNGLSSDRELNGPIMIPSPTPAKPKANAAARITSPTAHAGAAAKTSSGLLQASPGVSARVVASAAESRGSNQLHRGEALGVKRPVSKSVVQKKRTGGSEF
jgi:hypothetical protein